MSDLVDQVEQIRRTNNKLWMNILRLALKAKPVETKAILEAITDNDRKISDLLSQVAASTTK